MAEQYTDLKIRFDILDNQNDELATAIEDIKSTKSAVSIAPSSELIDCQLEQLQTQITNLAQGLPLRQDSSPRIKDVQINSGNFNFNSQNKQSNIRSNKLGNKPSKPEDLISEQSHSPPQFRNQKNNRDASVASNVSMLSGKSDKTLYLTAFHDDKGKNVALVNQWQQEGKLTDCKITSSKIKFSFKDRENVQKAKTMLGIKPRNSRGSFRGGGKPRGGSRAKNLI